MDVAFSTADTIVAVATPAGRGGLGVVRLSGPEATTIARTLTQRASPFEPRHATLAVVSDGPNRVDQVVVTWFAAPQSYTGEDVVEISGHGSPWLLNQIVELACAAGARLAQPGEFTLRAYLNQRIDLVQAEAVSDLVDAVTPLQVRVAMDQLEGTLTSAVRAIEVQLFDLAAKLEASLDFPDEGFHFITRAEVTNDLDQVARALSRLVADSRRGQLIRDGSLVVIAGRPNVGKSSLFNALVGVSRAIVTPQAGTTRDVLTERVDMLGVPVTLVDTAGVRSATDLIEAEGVRRAEQAREVAALTVVVLDGSQPFESDDVQLLHTVTSSSRPWVVVSNKQDLPTGWGDTERATLGQNRAHRVSASTGEGLEALRTVIVEALTGAGDAGGDGGLLESRRDTPMVSNQRHAQLVRQALAAVEQAKQNLAAGGTEELVLAELGDARDALEAVTGRRTADELLHHIFSRFCIGK